MNDATSHGAPIFRVDRQFLPAQLREHRWAVVDTLRLGEDWSCPHPLVPLVPQLYQEEAMLFPSLLDLNNLNLAQRGALYEQLCGAHQAGEEPAIVMLFDSDADSAAVYRHWVAHLIVAVRDQPQTLLRSYDPRVFVQLWRIFSAEQMRTLFGPINTWSVYHQGSWLQFACPDARRTHLAANKRQSEQLAQVEGINEVLALLTQPGQALPSRAPLAPQAVPVYATQPAAYSQLSVHIDQLLQTAHAQGWLREQDAALFALLGVLTSPQWHQHRAAAPRLAQARPSEQTLRDVLAPLTQNEWAQLLADARQQPQSSTTPPMMR